MILNCAIIDDEPLAVDLLVSYVQKIPFLNLVGKYHNAASAIAGLTTQPVHLVFLDIQMPEIDGMKLSQLLPQNTRVVFTTAFQQYALDSYRLNALDYLLKPISFQEFLQASNKALQWFSLVEQTAAGSAEQPSSIFVKSEYKLLQIKLDTIRYVEGLKDYVKIHTTESPHPILSLMNMKTMKQILPASQFIRVHRSFIVAKDKIREIDRNRIVFDNVYIPIGDSYKQAFAHYLATFNRG